MSGRPPSTTHAEIARAALELFVRNGFEETTVTQVADALGVGRRTLFRYFRSKNDMVWADFDRVLTRLRAALAASSPDEPMAVAVTNAVLSSNDYEGTAFEHLRLRMTLIARVPALQAHSAVRYAAWREIVAEFAARRLGQEPDDLVPTTVAHMALGATMAAFQRWVAHPDEDVKEHLRRAFALVHAAFARLEERPRPTESVRLPGGRVLQPPVV